MFTSSFDFSAATLRVADDSKLTIVSYFLLQNRYFSSKSSAEKDHHLFTKSQLSSSQDKRLRVLSA
jgi:hypothetical protein